MGKISSRQFIAHPLPFGNEAGLSQLTLSQLLHFFGRAKPSGFSANPSRVGIFPRGY